MAIKQNGNKSGSKAHTNKGDNDDENDQFHNDAHSHNPISSIDKSNKRQTITSHYNNVLITVEKSGTNVTNSVATPTPTPTTHQRPTD